MDAFRFKFSHCGKQKANENGQNQILALFPESWMNLVAWRQLLADLCRRRTPYASGEADKEWRFCAAPAHQASQFHLSHPDRT
jgi:hypothetical protein